MDAVITVRERAGHAERSSEAPAAVPAWAAAAAWGAGLLELAIGAGAMTSAIGGAARGAGIVLVVLGAAGLVWGAATLARGRVIAPRVGVAGVLVAMITGAILLGVDPARTSVLALAAASALLIAVALACGLRLRAGERPAGQPRLAVLFGAAVVIAALVTPALGATEAGRLAPDHGQHGFVDPGHH